MKQQFEFLTIALLYQGILCAVGFSQTQAEIQQFNAMNQKLMLIQNSFIWDDMDCTVEQIADLETVNVTIQELRRQFKLRAAEGGQQLATAWLSLQLETVLDNVQNGTLLPHQWKRFEEIALQMQMKLGGNWFSTVTNGLIAEKMNLSKDQTKSIQKIESDAAAEIGKIQQETQKRIEKIKQQVQVDVNEVLTQEQRETLESALGRPLLPAPEKAESNGKDRTVPKH